MNLIIKVGPIQIAAPHSKSAKAPPNAPAKAPSLLLESIHLKDHTVAHMKVSSSSWIGNSNTECSNKN